MHHVHVAGVGSQGLWLMLSSLISISPTGAQVPTTSYTCTQPNIAGFNDQGQCTAQSVMETKGGARPALLSTSLGVYGWDSIVPPSPHPFVVLDIPRRWCVGSVRMMFVHPSSIPALNLSVQSAERLSTNAERTILILNCQ